ERLLVSLNTPPRRIGVYSNFTCRRFSIAGMTRWLRYAFGLPKSNRNSTFTRSPFLAERADLDLEAPRVARLLIKHPVGVGDRLRPHQPLGRQVRERFLALARADALAHERGIDSGID